MYTRKAAVLTELTRAGESAGIEMVYRHYTLQAEISDCDRCDYAENVIVRPTLVGLESI